MSLPLVLHQSVFDDIDEAYHYYESQRPGLGDDFIATVEQVYSRISATPLMHQKIFQDVRRAVVRRFPYVVYYRPHPDRVEVIAVYHTRRDPAGWQARA
jgi:plasmid stabilization system protein ParE